MRRLSLPNWSGRTRQPGAPMRVPCRPRFRLGTGQRSSRATTRQSSCLLSRLRREGGRSQATTRLARAKTRSNRLEALVALNGLGCGKPFFRKGVWLATRPAIAADEYAEPDEHAEADEHAASNEHAAGWKPRRPAADEHAAQAPKKAAATRSAAVARRGS